MSLPADDAARVRAWAAVLATGEPVTWAAFRSSGPAAPTSGSVTIPGPVPGTAQLELLRRLALLHRDRPLPQVDSLAARVLASTGPGRGLVDPGLPGLESAPTPTASPPEPEDLPGNEITRAACGVLVPLLLAVPPAGGDRPRRRMRRRKRFVVHGSPLSRAAVRDALLAAGWSEGGARAHHLVIGRELETMMAEQWQARVESGAERRWRPLWRRWTTLNSLPPRLRLAGIAAALAGEHGPDRVQVLLAADGPGLSAALRAALGIEVAVVLPVIDPEATDLLRRLNPLLTMRAGAAGRDAASVPWRAALAAVRAEVPTGVLGAPPGMVAWAREAGAALSTSLSEAAARGDYAVHGSTGLVVPPRSAPGRRRTPDPDAVADLATRLVAELWRRNPTGGQV